MPVIRKRSFEVHSLIFAFLIIAVCEVFFLIDVFADLFRIDIDISWIDHSLIEFISAVTLALALIVVGMQIIKLLREHRVVTDSVQVASGELLVVINNRFKEWQLTASESEIALLLIKGFSAQEIADMRNTRAGTVKSQSSAIYHKAGVRGRNELVAYFVEDLLGGTASGKE